MVIDYVISVIDYVIFFRKNSSCFYIGQIKMFGYISHEELFKTAYNMNTEAVPDECTLVNVDEETRLIIGTDIVIKHDFTLSYWNDAITVSMDDVDITICNDLGYSREYKCFPVWEIEKAVKYLNSKIRHYQECVKEYETELFKEGNFVTYVQ